MSTRRYKVHSGYKKELDSLAMLSPFLYSLRRKPKALSPIELGEGLSLHTMLTYQVRVICIVHDAPVFEVVKEERG